MVLNSHSKDGIQIVQMQGRFDAAEISQFTDWLEKNLTPTSARLVINLGGVDFIDSSGLAALVKALKRSRDHEGDVFLCRLQPTVKIIVELTRMDRVFRIFETEAAAVAAFPTTS